MVSICAVLIKLWPLVHWSAIPVLAWLFISNLRQLRSLILERHQLAGLGLSPTQWGTCFLMRGTSTAVIFQRILSARSDDQEQFTAIDRLNLFDIDIWVAVVLGLLPMVYSVKKHASNNKLQSMFIGISLVVCLGALFSPLGHVHYLVANFIVAVHDAMMFPAQGQPPEPTFDHRESLYQYCWSSLPALLGSVLALAGAFLLLFPNWKARWGIGLWVIGMATGARSAWWLYSGGWKSLFVFPFDEPFQLEESRAFFFAVLFFNSFVVLIALTAGAKYTVVKSPELVKALSQFQPSFKLYWLVLLLNAWHMISGLGHYSSILNVDYHLLFAMVLCLLCVDPRRIRIWFLATAFWWRLIGLLLLAVVATGYLYIVYNLTLDVFGHSITPVIAQIVVAICGVVFFLWAIYMLLRPRVQRDWSEPPEAGLVRDGLSARNLVAVPILIVTVLYLNVIGVLTIFPLWIALTSI